MYEQMKEILGRFEGFVKNLIARDSSLDTFQRAYQVTRTTIGRIYRAYEVHEIRLE